MGKTGYKADVIRKIIWLIAGLLFFTVLYDVQHAGAQSKPPLEFQVKAAFLYNFTRFVNWPPSAFKSPDAPFVIGILGTDPFGTYLDDLVHDEKLGEHKIIIERYNDISDMDNCQILFVGAYDAAKIKEIMTAIGHRNMLTVSDEDNFKKQGGIVRFFKEDSKVRLEINIAAAKGSQLEISAKLLRLAKVN